MFDLIHKKYTMYKLLVFLLLYINIWLSFTVVYFILDVYELGLIVDHYASFSHQNSDWDLMTRSLYLSAITLLSVGYGDVTPFGLSRAVAMIQALIGYLLPVVIVFNLSLFFIVEKNKS
ncbi:two pore domain potassium channel family protein [Bacillus suaedae]|uniref:Two pore domain potassium channel family protein n=1 Tax=Halalkalibacter suaedae TaxID=2822140 RepID=A0A941AQ68_9BACI|nr:two pore domain potassium channel family protein [Bacillus suaedae]MBP3953560.1 two pore domain potassium channel family protein [Bacillus suaedae]